LVVLDLDFVKFAPYIALGDDFWYHVLFF
jgi:hypothetical protein